MEETLSKIILEVENLKTHFFLDEGVLKAVDGVSFTINEGETLGIVGESGCGKSVTAQSILRIVPSPGKLVSGKINLILNEDEKIDIVHLKQDSESIRDIRGGKISMIFQDPMTSLSPVHTIGSQIVEAIRLHRNSNKKEAAAIAVDMLKKVGIPSPESRFFSYPHELSGGLRQRAVIAMALSCNPILLVADEPTTALDVTIQAQILELMREMQDQYKMAVLYITHNLGVIAEMAKKVAVMYLGKIVEYAPVEEIFNNPMHPYTVNLLKALPKLGKKGGGRLTAIEGTVPIPIGLPNQCGFYLRCPNAIEGKCDNSIPELLLTDTDHFVSCFLYNNHNKKEL
jgi:oligopeptide/dipeptide ABC transporter ATP-binding protein